VAAQRYFSVSVYVYQDRVSFALVERRYRPNGTACNVTALRQQHAPRSESIYDLAAALYDFCFDCGVLSSLPQQD
jgi:hypothetical protein